MDKTRKLRRELGYALAQLHGLQEAVDPSLGDAATKALALQVREQAGICLDLLDKYQSSVPGRMWLDAERRCQPLREDLRRTEKLFRSNSGEWEGRTLTRTDIRRMCDWTWVDFQEQGYELEEDSSGDNGIDAELIFQLAQPLDPFESHSGVVPDEVMGLLDDESDGTLEASRLRFTLPMDEESRGHTLIVLVPSHTGLVYEHQYGGSSGRRIEIEGFLVPAHANQEAKSELEQFFLADFGDNGLGDPGHAEALEGVREAIRKISYRGSGDRLAPLEVNDARLGELDEAWVPVLTPDGPGYLAWINSD